MKPAKRKPAEPKAANLFDAVMQLERLKADSTPEALQARIAARQAEVFPAEKIAEMQRSLAEKIEPLLKELTE